MASRKASSKQRVTFFTKLFALVFLSAVIAVFSYLTTALGWTNPTQAPPNGSGILTATNGKLSIGTATPSSSLVAVAGDMSMLGNRIKDLLTPFDDNDAVNKAYVTSAVGAAGGNTIVTLYGVSSLTPTAQSTTRPGGVISSCLRGYAGNGTCSGSITAPVQPGTGTPTCASKLGAGWSDLYAGYGPLNVMYTWYGNQAWPPDEEQTPDQVATLSDSICSTASFAYVRDVSMSLATAQVANTQAFVSACTPDQCNTCRVCIK